MANLERFFDRLEKSLLPDPIPQYRTKLLAASAARFALQRLKMKEEAEEFGLLYELIERYADNDCQLPCDHVYALYRLAGEHREHWNIDYASPAVERYCTVLQFVCNHENLPPANVAGFAELLRDLLQLTEEEISEQRRLLNSFSLTISTTVLGMELRPECNASLRLRSLVTPLKPIPSVSLSKIEDTDWTLMPSQVEIPYLVGQPDIVYSPSPAPKSLVSQHAA